jgi:hypothetical protein
MKAILSLFGMLIGLLLFLGLPVGVIILLIWAFKRKDKFEAEKFTKLSIALNGQIVPDDKGNPSYVRTVIEGIELRVWTVAEEVYSNDPDDYTHGVSYYLFMDILINHGFNLTIWQETLGSKLFDKSGKAASVKTGDPVFDNKYRVQADQPDQALAFLQVPKRRTALENLNAKGFYLFKVDSNSVQIKKPYVPMRDHVATNLQDYAAQICNLAL